MAGMRQNTDNMIQFFSIQDKIFGQKTSQHFYRKYDAVSKLKQNNVNVLITLNKILEKILLNTSDVDPTVMLHTGLDYHSEALGLALQSLSWFFEATSDHIWTKRMELGEEIHSYASFLIGSN